MTDTVNRVLETFATLGVVRKELDGGIANIQKLLLVFDERNNGFALLMLLPKSPPNDTMYPCVSLQASVGQDL